MKNFMTILFLCCAGYLGTVDWNSFDPGPTFTRFFAVVGLIVVVFFGRIIVGLVLDDLEKKMRTLVTYYLFASSFLAH